MRATAVVSHTDCPFCKVTVAVQNNGRLAPHTRGKGSIQKFLKRKRDCKGSGFLAEPDRRKPCAKYWTAEQEQILRELWPKAEMQEVLRALSPRSELSISQHAVKLGVRREFFRKPWTAEQIKLFRKLYPHQPVPQTAAACGHTVTQCYGRAKKLGLSLSPEYRRAYLSRCGNQLAAHSASIVARFPKGHVPLNKGLRRPGWYRGRMRETQFKKGQRPTNTVPVGAIIPNADGYLRVKVTNLPEGPGKRGGSSPNWKFLHRIIWEAAHGPIPRGYRIWWKDGNHRNCSLANLELLSGKDHMKRTTIHNWPEPVRRVIQLAGALKRKINQREKRNGKDNLGPKGQIVRDARLARQGRVTRAVGSR